MKWWYAVVPALLLPLTRGAAAEDPREAARELARGIAEFAGSRDGVALTYRTAGQGLAALEPRYRAMLESALREARARLDRSGAVDVRVTLSESPTRRLLVGEARRGDGRRTWIVSWPPEADALPARLERTLLFEQREPVLDAAVTGDGVLVLSTSRLSVLSRAGGGWDVTRSVPLVAPKPWPRDPRARLTLSGASWKAYLPGAVCAGAWQPSLTLACRAGDEPWPVDAGGRHLLLGNFAASRNYFDGRVTTPSGARQAVAPFYSAAAVEEAGDVLWLFAAVDGRTLLAGRTFATEPLPVHWGSDIAAAGARCHGAIPVVATRPGEESEALEAFAIVNRQAEAIAPPLPMPGPVTALWPAPGGVIAVARNASPERYAAYLVRVGCE